MIIGLGWGIDNSPSKPNQLTQKQTKRRASSQHSINIKFPHTENELKILFRFLALP
jgi:hypothetical protein